MKVLVVEDDGNIREGLLAILQAEGYETCSASDGREGLARFEAERPQFVLLDVMMPAMNGYDVFKRMRAVDPNVPIVFVSAKSEEIDRVLGLELGADDYIPKPFGVKEVVARIRAVTRRCLRAEAPSASPPFVMRDLEVVPAELRARRGAEVIDLSLREVGILRLLNEQRGRVVDRDQFWNRLWGFEHAPNSRTLDQQISKLRKRIEVDPAEPEIIRTVHGVGYRFDG